MRSYLKPRRLEAVIRLIQVTGLGPSVGPSNQRLTTLMNGNPRSAGNWILLAGEHPELFRIKTQPKNPADHSLSLIARFYRTPDVRKNPLQWADIKLLIDMAISLHERQVRDSERQKTIIAAFAAIAAAMVGALIAGLFALVTKK